MTLKSPLGHNKALMRDGDSRHLVSWFSSPRAQCSSWSMTTEFLPQLGIKHLDALSVSWRHFPHWKPWHSPERNSP